jgi:hypothetical protein
VIRVPVTENVDAIKKQAQTTIDGLVSDVQIPAEWLKFIFYNEKIRFEHILNPELRR